MCPGIRLFHLNSLVSIVSNIPMSRSRRDVANRSNFLGQEYGHVREDIDKYTNRLSYLGPRLIILPVH